MKIVGLDPSLSSFGAALVWPRQPELTQLYRWEAHKQKPPRRGHERIDWLAEQVMPACRGADVVAIEGLAYAARGTGSHDLAGLHWIIRHALWAHGIPYVVVPIPVRCKWLTGHGNASKEACLVSAIKRFPDFEVSCTDEADAITLAAMACEAVGVPIVRMPAERRELLFGTNKEGRPVIPWPGMT